MGYVPKPEGESALDWTVEEAQRRGARLVVGNSSRGAGAYSGSNLALEEKLRGVQERLAGSEAEHQVRQPLRDMHPPRSSSTS